MSPDCAALAACENCCAMAEKLAPERILFTNSQALLLISSSEAELSTSKKISANKN